MIEAKDFVMDLFQLVEFHLLRMNANLCKIVPICKLCSACQSVFMSKLNESVQEHGCPDVDRCKAQP